MKKLFAIALGALYLLLWNDPAYSQSSNPFNPDYAWCNVRGSVAVRKATQWACLTPGASGQVLQSGGPGADVSWLTTTGSGTVTSVGLSMPAFLTVTGSPVTAAGTLTGTLASQTANTFFVAPNGSAGAPTFRAMAAADMPSGGVISGGVITGTFPALTIGSGQVTGTMIGTGAVATANIAGSAVDNARLATAADGTIKSNIAGSVQRPTDNTISSVMDYILGSTQGNVAFRGSAGWQGLAPSAGNILQSNGAGSNPSWVSPSAAIPAAVGIGHRLTLVSGQPVMTAGVSAQTTVYSTPYQSDLLLLWNGANYVPTHCAQTSQLLSDTTKSPGAAAANQLYDLFAWNDSGTCRVTRGPAWSAGTAGSNIVRGTGVGSTSISRANNGILSNTVAITNGPAAAFGTYMGTIMTDTGSGVVSMQGGSNIAGCGQGVFGLWNMYNRRQTSSAVFNATAGTHNYSGNVYRPWANSTACSVSFVQGLNEDSVFALTSSTLGPAVGNGGAAISLGLNSTTTAVLPVINHATNVSTGTASSVVSYAYNNLPGLGQNTITALELSDGTNSNGFVDQGAFLLTTTSWY